MSELAQRAARIAKKFADVLSSPNGWAAKWAMDSLKDEAAEMAQLIADQAARIADLEAALTRAAGLGSDEEGLS